MSVHTLRSSNSQSAHESDVNFHFRRSGAEWNDIKSTQSNTSNISLSYFYGMKDFEAVVRRPLHTLKKGDEKTKSPYRLAALHLQSKLKAGQT